MQSFCRTGLSQRLPKCQPVLTRLMRLVTTHGTTLFTLLGMRSPATANGLRNGSIVTCLVVAITRNSSTALRRPHEQVLSKWIYARRNDDDRGRAPDLAGLCLLRRHRSAFGGREPCASHARALHRTDLRVRRHRHSTQGIAVVDRRWRTRRDRDRSGIPTGNFFLLAAGSPAH